MLALSLETMCTLEEHFINKGILLGREEGREEGLTKGIRLGRAEGREEGREEGIIQVAKNLLSQGSTLTAPDD